MMRKNRASMWRILWLAALPISCTGVIARPAGAGGAAQTSADPLECGKEFEPCCDDPSKPPCESTPDLRCNDSACVVCAHIPALRPECRNVATSGVASADATERNDVAERGPQLGIDGSSCTRWSSGDMPSNPAAGRSQTAFQVDLGTPHAIDDLTLWLAMTPDGPVNMALEYGNDGKTWQTEWSGTRAMSGWEPWKYQLSQKTTARYFRVVFYNGPSWAAIRELALYECPAGTSADSGAQKADAAP